MKRFFLFIAGFFLIATPALAVGACPPDDPYYRLCELGSLNVGSVVGAVVEGLFVLAIIVALFYLIWGGFRWLTSGGDKSAVGAAREHIVAAIVGLVIIFLSYFILNLLLQFFVPGVSLNNLKVPSISISGSSSNHTATNSATTKCTSSSKCLK